MWPEPAGGGPPGPGPGPGRPSAATGGFQIALCGQQTNETKGRFFINGNLLDSLIYEDPDTGTPINMSEYTPANNHHVCFGASAGNGSFFNGVIDDIGIWYRALDSCEILDLYNANSSCTNGINELDNSSVNLYPNPTNGSVTLSFSNTTNGQVILTDLLGKEVLRKNFTSNLVELDLKKLNATGTYFAKVLDADGSVIAIKKLIYQ